jgi:Tfp pilus assembly protein FimT
MKKIGILGILICLVIAAFSYYSTQQTVATHVDTGEYLNRAFSVTKADVEGYTIHNWSVIDKDYKSVEQLKQLGTKLNKTFQVLNAKESIDQQDDQNSYALRGTWQNGAKVQLMINSMKFQDHAPQTVLVVRVENETSDLSDYSQLIKIVRETAQQAHTIPQISTCIKGLLADKMEDGASNALVKEVFQKVKAKEVEGVRSDLVTSVSGYSALSKDYIVTNGQKMNLQVAVHYDANQGKTRVLVGSPIVTIEY